VLQDSKRTQIPSGALFDVALNVRDSFWLSLSTHCSQSISVTIGLLLVAEVEILPLVVGKPLES
jgi:hypothetical protein